jgi:EAL domain-containing protein (putative c-di-GMP-specific phosphodiesterase class I)/GGDEF domain-containing protein
METAHGLVQEERRGLTRREAERQDAVKEHVTELRQDVALQLREVLERRSITTVFQPIFGFREGRVLGHEALVRGPAGSLLEAPQELFAAARDGGRFVELGIICIQEVLRNFAVRQLPGLLFLNLSPQLVAQRGFDQERARDFLSGIGLDAQRVVIELTEEYPTFDFRLVQESLALYRSMGFRVAIDDLGEGFASLRLWSELRPEFVKADKHFVTGVAHDPVKLQFLRSIQQIAESCGSLVIAEGIENADDFRLAKDIGIACGQGWFIGRPCEVPARDPPAAVLQANADLRVPVAPSPRRREASGRKARDFLRAVDAVAPQETMATLLERFACTPALAAIPVAGATGIVGVVSRAWLAQARVAGETQRTQASPCADCMDASPIRVEADLDLEALTALLVESDAARMADGFVIVSQGCYLGMGRAQDVLRALAESRALAAQYTNPLSMLPGQVPVNEHLERLLARGIAFAVWFVEVDQMRGLNDGAGFRKGDALIRDTGALLESASVPGLDMVGHFSGGRFVVLMQSGDWNTRATQVVDGFTTLAAAHVPAAVFERGYFTARTREGLETIRPLPRLSIGLLPVLPGVHETRHEVLAIAKLANRRARAHAGSSVVVDHYHGNAYPQSLLWQDEA